MLSASNLQSDADQLKAAADQAIAACGGDAREAVKALIVANHFLETDLEKLRVAVSMGYARGKLFEAAKTLPRDRKGEMIDAKRKGTHPLGDHCNGSLFGRPPERAVKQRASCRHDLAAYGNGSGSKLKQPDALREARVIRQARAPGRQAQGRDCAERRGHRGNHRSSQPRSIPRHRQAVRVSR
jgi:hypothetical protein